MEDYDLAIMIIRCLMQQDEEIEKQSKMLEELEKGFTELLAPYKDQLDFLEQEDFKNSKKNLDADSEKVDSKKSVWPEPGD